MAESDLRTLRAIVMEQQSQIDCLTRLSNYLLHAHFALCKCLQHNANTCIPAQCSMHNASCKYLQQRGMVSSEHRQASFEDLILRDRHPEEFTKLLLEPRVARYILMGIGNIPAGLLLSSSRSCMESMF